MDPAGPRGGAARHPVVGRVRDRAAQTAIDQPLFTTKHLVQSFYPRSFEPGGLLVEERFGSAVVAGLERRGHHVAVQGPWSLGRVCGVGREDSWVFAAATPRLMQAYAAGR